MNVHGLRLAAALIPAALLLHEGVYTLSGGGLANAHSYYEVAVPLAVTAAASVALAALLLPLVATGCDRGQRRLAPFGTAAALTLIFAAQELAEALLLGGGASLGAALASAWILPPLALLLGALVASAVDWLGRAGELLAALSTRARSPRRPRRARSPRPPRAVALGTISPLAFGLARRPPPLAIGT